MIVAQPGTNTTRAKFGLATYATTPGQLQAIAIIITLACVLLLAVTESGLSSMNHSIQTIGKDTVPSIVAAEKIRASLADMDANAANCFFSQGTREARNTYETDRHAAADSLVSAANNITYGNEERVPILTMVDGLQGYVGLVETARSKGFPLGMDALKQASTQMHSQLLPAAESLDKANFAHLDSIYAASKETIPGTLGRLWMVGVLLFAALIGLQVYITVRMKRLVTIPAAAASLLLLGWIVSMGNAIGLVQADLKTAKEDAFDSIHALWKTRAIAYDANADESLYLLERGSVRTPESGTALDQAFKQNVSQIIGPTAPDQILQQLGSGKPNLSGLIGTELKNITFDGEKEAATEMVKTYAAYLAIDEKIRQLETSGSHQQAVELCTGTKEGESNWCFDQFDKALTKTLDINQKAFDRSIEKSFADIAGLNIAAPIVSAIIIALAWVGILPRLREYRA
jgi:hypothetical protein